MGFNLAFVVFIILIQQCNCKGENIKDIRVQKMDNNVEECNIFQGCWVYDESYQPYYNSSSCPYIAKEFDCLKNGRPDQFYLAYKWAPSSCSLPRFDGEEFLRRFKGKKIMFVGDSLSVDQWQSFICMLHAATPHSNFTLTVKGNLSTFHSQEHQVWVMLYHSVFLVDVVVENKKRVLKLESIENGNCWMGMDVLIFNSWHWWVHKGSNQGWDYIEMGGKKYKDMDRLTAFKYGLTTWSHWVENNTKNDTRVFFLGISPTHYRGQEWNGTSSTTCIGETRPVPGSSYPGDLPPAMSVINQVLNAMSVKVELLDITRLSQLRKDGHPSIYGIDGDKGNDCSHWCLPGIPDTWNQLLYSMLLLRSKARF